MRRPVVIHEQHRGFVFPLTRNQISIRIRAEKGGLKRCALVYSKCIGDMGACDTQAMTCYASDQLFDYFDCEISDDDSVCYLKYYFALDTGKETLYLNYNGISTDTPADGFFMYQYTNDRDIFDIPDWARDAVVYQIFPERFANGCPGNDPEGAKPWGTAPTRTNFMGGDLSGIIEKIGYLADLGVNTLYLNPVFASVSNHKYDTADYLEIDPSFGNKEDLKGLVDTCHLNGIRVILDGVFNHCGYDFGPFRDVLKKGTDSEYKDWFYIKRYPVRSAGDYECFGYFGGMPKLRLSNPDTRAYILGVVRYWMEETGIDGWRLDVADEMDQTFLREFRGHVKGIDPDCLILAETWHENTDMLKGDQFDSLMNYPFRDAVTEYFARGRITTDEFDARINKIIGVYPKPAAGCLYNLLGSHDTPRLLTLCGGDVRRMKAAVAFQFCFPGIPSVYYGDEIGLKGENDPDCRRCMEWDESRQDRGLYDFYRTMIGIRHTYEAVRRGGFERNCGGADDPVYGFIRSYGDSRVYVAINNADCQRKVDIPVMEEGGTLAELLSGKEYPVLKMGKPFFFSKNGTGYKNLVSLTLAPYQVCVLTCGAAQ